ncbi:hypothetical protein [Brachybacterium sp. FME24]|uniref:hypothetical protein n=1 Tax=Brachybacterium sp. FME24 TaxID=2742605 RepID=UPI0018678D8A|nr:hypothetical protein [Brachybacterium sp. FME24]
MRPCPHRHLSPLEGCIIDTLILLAFGLSFVVILGVAVYRMISRRNQARDEAREAGFPSGERPRTDEQKSQDKRTATVWGCAVLLIPCVLVLAYYLTR